MAAGGIDAARTTTSSNVAESRRRQPPARPADHRRGLRRGRRVPVLGPGREHHRHPRAGRRRVRRPMTDASRAVLDRERIRELFDLRTSIVVVHRRRPHRRSAPARGTSCASPGPVHAGTVHELSGIDGDLFWHGLPEPDRPHFSAFSLRRLRRGPPQPRRVRLVARRRRRRRRRRLRVEHARRWAASQHRRYRALVQPSFVPAKAQWWIAQVDRRDRARPHRLVRRRRPGRAQRRLLRRHPGAHDHRQLRHRRRPGARRPRAASATRPRSPRSSARSSRPGATHPQDDLISVLDRGRAHRRRRHPPADRRRDPLLRLPAARRRVGHDLEADGHHARRAAASGPSVLDAVRDDRSAAARRPSRSRCAGSRPTRCSPAGSPRTPSCAASSSRRARSLHLCLGAANRDPERWDRPDEYDIRRPLKPSFGFGGGPHICLGMHVARAEMSVGIGALLDRLPEPAARPRRRAARRLIGFYERGVTEIPVVFG